MIRRRIGVLLPVLVLVLSIAAAPAGATVPPDGFSFVTSAVYRYGGGIALVVPLQFHCPTGATDVEYASLQVVQIRDGRTVSGAGGTPSLANCPLPDQRVASTVISSTDSFRAGKAFAVLTDGSYTQPWTPRHRVLQVPAKDSSPLNTSSRKVLGASRSTDGRHVTLRAAVLCDSGTATDAYGLVVQQPAAAGQASVAFSGARHVLCTGDWQRVSIDMLNQAGQVIQDGPAFATVDGAIATVSLTRSGHA